MRDLYLRFPDKITSLSFLYNDVEEIVVTPAEGMDDHVADLPGIFAPSESAEVETHRVGSPRFRALDVIGVLYAEPAQPIDPDNPPAPIPLDGWHVNVRAYPDEDTSALVPFEVVPAHPRRVWG